MLNTIEQKSFYQQLGENIKSVRMRKDLKQDVLAGRLGFTRNSISNIEAGKQKIQLHSLLELASCLEVPVLELLPRLEDVKVETTNLKLEKKAAKSEVSNNAATMEIIKDFIRLSTTTSK